VKDKGVGIARCEGDFIIYYTGTNEATDTYPCLILAGTSLKVVERLMQLGWKRGEIILFISGGFLNPNTKRCLGKRGLIYQLHL